MKEWFFFDGFFIGIKKDEKSIFMI